MTNTENPIERVRERVESLPDEVWDCERCGSDDSMKIRRSGLNHGFHADDIMLKCMECWHTPTHGIPFENPEEFDREVEERNGRSIDFARSGEGELYERLRDLGYLSKAKDEE